MMTAYTDPAAAHAQRLADKYRARGLDDLADTWQRVAVGRQWGERARNPNGELEETTAPTGEGR